MRQHPVEQLTAGTDEGLALSVLFGAGRLADQHHLGRGIAVGEAEIERGLLQCAAIERRQRRLDLGDAPAAGGNLARALDHAGGRAQEQRLGDPRSGCRRRPPGREVPGREVKAPRLCGRR